MTSKTPHISIHTSIQVIQIVEKKTIHSTPYTARKTIYFLLKINVDLAMEIKPDKGIDLDMCKVKNKTCKLDRC